MTTNRPPFIHLRLHTSYSICEGAVKIDQLVKACIDNDMPACAITDTNNMFGILDYSMQCAKAGIQPIIGCQFDIEFSEVCAPITLLIQNEGGYKNMLKIMTSYYDKHCISIDHLRQYKDGIIVLSGGYKGPAGVLYLNYPERYATEFLNELHSIFGENLYIEISRTYNRDEYKSEKFFVKYATENSIPLVATNNVFFLAKNMHKAQNILMCIADGTYISQTDRRIISEHCYFKTTDEMYELFKDIPEAVINTSVIARRCGFMPEPHSPMLPRFDDGSGHNEEDILRQQAMEGLQYRIQNEVIHYKENKDRSIEDITREYAERLEYEYNVIKNMGFCGYFLMVSDFVKWAKSNDIPVGPGRGSGAGSIVGWTLFITELDPIKYHLIFERFLNPDRISMPDFDIDFCQERRDEVIDYVKRKYGEDKIAHIIALGTLQARVVLRDVGRVIQMPCSKVDRISKLVPNNPTHPIDLERALEIEPELTNLMQEDESVEFLIKTGLLLEGLFRHASVHAAGIVIGQKSIDEIIPIYKDEESDIAITQFNMKFAEKAGLVKFDFLGLKTLTMIKQACDLIGLDITKIPLDDEKTFKLMQDVNVIGVFQLESTGIRDVIKKLKPDCLEDIIALISLYRPGPMDSIPTYLARKHGLETVTYLHPCIESILSSTYGIMIYQEQVMKIAQVMGGYTLAQADLLRRAMGKKIPQEMEKHRKIFIEGAKKQNISEQVAATVFAQMEKFAGYGFNRSHAAAYALISYQTAYLKANYMHEFFIATMNLDITNLDKIAIYVQDAKMNGIKLLPPDINKSAPIFKREGNYIRYALGAIKGSSTISSQEMIDEREKTGTFSSIQDFFARINKKCLNKRQIEALIISGVFDSLHSNRNEVFQYFLKTAALADSAVNKQKSLFEDSISSNTTIDTYPDWTITEKLDKERVAMGLYLNEHPMDLYLDYLPNCNITGSNHFYDMNKQKLTVAGVMLTKREKLSKNTQKYAFITISDQHNSFEVVVMPNIYQNVNKILKPGKILLLDVIVQYEEGMLRITASSLQDIDAILAKQKVYLELAPNTDIKSLQKMLAAFEDGDNAISFILYQNNSRKIEIETTYKKKMSIENRKKIRQIKGVRFYTPNKDNNYIN